MTTMQDSTAIALAALRRQVAVVVPDIDPDAVRDGVTLTELGCSSMDRAEIVVLTMEELGLEVPVSEFASAKDVSSLVALLGSRL